MAIDFTLTTQQRDLQRASRKFAKEVLSEARRAELLATPEERFLATRPAYEAMVAAGNLRKCIPATAGGENAGLIDMAILAEEFYSVNASVTLTVLGTVLGLLPILLGGTPDQCKRLLVPFLKTGGAPLAGFCSSEPGGSANSGSPPPGEGVRTTARREGDTWVINGRKKWVSSATGWNREGADVLCVVCRTDAAAPPNEGISIIAVEGPVKGLIFERAIDTIGHRAHLVPQFGLQNVATPRRNLLGQEGAGLALTAAAFTGTAALVGIFGVALMRAAFEFALHFAQTEKRGGVHPIIEHQAVGYALADAKTTIEAARYLSWRACHAVDTQSPGADELAIEAKIFGSEAAVRVITDLMRVVGVDSYDHEAPFARLLQDALALPIFDGGNMGVRRRQLHMMFRQGSYDPLAASGAA
ncbi:acyl-CoA dehydrogenase family protein [Bradyrhizobium sp. CB82]|uniref:acyl-CoA dehydrogenase family protein n=1 Tax=Bradyrhizobium sp. CB82 TaxID=3039159 RepID=UPI0024B1790E|nr:acyl-CoA dehydrogenase family protein [Bradyrhizobium sp. CB82]WFU39559.1 acyl-CoA dehydrogenase family protein [Bradyrhizobium sp. CB82]